MKGLIFGIISVASVLTATVGLPHVSAPVEKQGTTEAGYDELLNLVNKTSSEAIPVILGAYMDLQTILLYFQNSEKVVDKVIEIATTADERMKEIIQTAFTKINPSVPLEQVALLVKDTLAQVQAEITKTTDEIEKLVKSDLPDAVSWVHEVVKQFQRDLSKVTQPLKDRADSLLPKPL